MVAALLAGCALTPPPPHDEVVDQALPKGTHIPPQWVADPGRRGTVTNDWLPSFNDPALDAIVAEAIANNLDLRQAAAQVEIARETVAVVGAQLRPQVSAQFSAATTRDKDQDTRFDSPRAYAAVTWELDLWGRLRAQPAAAEAGSQATALDYAYARQSLAATAAKSWYLTSEARQLVALAEQAVTIYARLFELAKVRRAAGKVGDLDVAEASASLNAAQSQLRAVQSAYSEARRGLEVLLGRYPAAALKVAETFVPAPPPVQAGLPSALLERWPDLVAAERQVLAAFRAQEAARLALLPSFGLSLAGGCPTGCSRCCA